MFRTYNIHLLSYLIIGLFFVQTAYSQDSTKANQNSTMLDQVQSIGLNSAENGITVYYSNGYSQQARDLGQSFSKAIHFFEDSLGIAIPFKLALIDSAAWKKLGSIPYGLPYVDGIDDQDSPVAVLPAGGKGAVYKSLKQLKKTLSDKTKNRLEKLGYTWENAIQKMVYLIGFHEIGHVYSDAYGIGKPAQWLSEFMASYFAYLFLHYEEPRSAEIWNITGQAILQNYEPDHRTLNEFEKLYFRVGVADYSWYQSAFEKRVKPLVVKHGFSLLPKIKEEFPENVGTFEAWKVISRLEDMYPGFKEWASIFQE